MSHEGTDFTSSERTGPTRAESRSSAGQQDTYLEKAPDYERALLECAAGSHSAVGEIYVREREHLRAVANRIVGDMSRAEDVIHEAFALVLRFSKDFDPAR